MARDPSIYKPTERFTGRTQDYARYRPGYPQAVIDTLAHDLGFTKAHVVADIGSGTGISTQLFLRNGNAVYSVEPNDEMRAAAESSLIGYPDYHSVRGSAEATTLQAASIDLVVAGQAWHWFEPVAARKEFARILREPRRVALFWNTRLAQSTPFMAAYDEIVKKYSAQVPHVRHEETSAEEIAMLFANRRFAYVTIPNDQDLDLATLTGRTFSSSYMPRSNDPRAPEVTADLNAIFGKYARDGKVHFRYVTELYSGHVNAD